MDSSLKRRSRHGRRYPSPLYSSSSSPRRQRRIYYRDQFDDEEDPEETFLEEDIIHRALQIERNRERILRKQFEFIVSNVKELERRRYRRERYYSPEDSHRPERHSSHRHFSTDRYEHSASRMRSKSRKTADLTYFQITMIYRGSHDQTNGDEIMILQERRIVFKGFLKNNESFTYRIRSIGDEEQPAPVTLDIYRNDFYDCSFDLDLQNGEIHPPNDLLEIRRIQFISSEIKNGSNEERATREMTLREKPPNENRKSSSKGKMNVEEQQPVRSNQVSTNQAKGKQKREETSVSRSTTSSNENRSRTTNQSRSSTPQVESSSSTVNTKKQSKAKPIDEEEHSDRDDQTNVSKPSERPKPTYGPPQVSTFAHSDSDGSEEFSIKKREDSNHQNQKDDDDDDDDEEKTRADEKENDSSIARNDDQEQENERGGENDGERPGFVNFLQLLQAMSGGGVRVTSSNDDGDGIQGLLARLGIVTEQNAKRKSKNVTPRSVGNVENHLLVYLDQSIDDPSIKRNLLSLVNYVKLFDDPDDCIAFINSVSNERIVFIVSDSLGDPVISRIQDLQQVFRIYVLCQTEEQVSDWSTNNPKIRGIFTDLSETLEQIRLDIEEDDDDLLSFTLTKRDSNQKDQPEFLVQQMMKEILLDSDEMNDAKKELIDFASNEYENNPEQLNQIEAFQDHFIKENPLKFYQKNSFLYKMLRKGFRIPEADILFKLRFFIQSLHQLIISSKRTWSTNIVYRSQWLNPDEIESLKKHSDGGLLAFSHFFLASKEKPDEKDKSNDENDEREEVLFEIDLGQNACTMSFNDDHLLLTFGLVTRIENLSKEKSGRTRVQLKVLPSDDQQIENILEPMRKEIRAPYPSLRLIKLFIELEEYSYAVLLGQTLLAEWNGAKKDPLLALARLYHSLGTVLYEKEQYDQALDVIKKSHSIYLRYLPEDSPQLSPTWNNMGSIYLRQGKTELALEHHERALAIQLKSPSPDLPSIISYSNNIGGVYLKLERYDEALVHFKRALQIEEQTLPKNHPELAGSYHRIGGVYFRQNNHEKALEYYNKTLEIELASLPDNHPTIAVTYHNRGTAFEGLGRLEEAVESAEKAVQQLLKTLPKENPQVRMNQAYVDRLKQKLWVKQLFSSE